MKRLLLLSNSKNYGHIYLEHAATIIEHFLGNEVRRVIFIPFAAVRFSFDDYASLVRWRFEGLGYAVDSIHEIEDKKSAIASAEAIMIGGGNTFHLLKCLYESDLIDPIRQRVIEGAPYIGWSAGSNIACPTIQTTNDMPIVEPPSLASLGLVPFQINPHYTEFHPPGHQGETREERIIEFIEVNPGVHVLGLREGSLLRIEDSQVKLLGGKTARVFLKGQEAKEYGADDDLSFLVNE